MPQVRVGRSRPNLSYHDDRRPPANVSPQHRTVILMDHHGTGGALWEGSGQPCELPESFVENPVEETVDRDDPNQASATTSTGMPFSTDVPDNGSIADSSVSTFEFTPGSRLATPRRTPSTS